MAMSDADKIAILSQDKELRMLYTTVDLDKLDSEIQICSNYGECVYCKKECDRAYLFYTTRDLYSRNMPMMACSCNCEAALSKNPDKCIECDNYYIHTRYDGNVCPNCNFNKWIEKTVSDNTDMSMNMLRLNLYEIAKVSMHI